MIGIVPAAGHARRVQPLPHSKEILPVGGRPVMDHVIERMRRAGCRDIVVVTRPEKRDVRHRAAALGVRVVLARPATVPASVLAGLWDTADDDIVLIGFPDTVWEPADGYVRLLEALREPFDVVLGLFEGAERERSDVVDLDPSGRVAGVEVSPAAPRSPWIWGCAAVRARALTGIDAEPDLGYRWDALARQGRVAGVRLSRKFTDVGTAEVLGRLSGRRET